MKKSELVKFVIAQKQKKLAAINAKINEHKIILAEAEINRLGLLPLFEYLKPSIDDYKKLLVVYELKMVGLHLSMNG